MTHVTLKKTNLIPSLFLLFLLFYSPLHAQNYTPSDPITLSGQSNITIEGKLFTSGSGGAAIKLTNCTNIKIINCKFENIPNDYGINPAGCTNVEITGCVFIKFRSGVYSTNSTGINFHCNQLYDIAGSHPRGQVVQLNDCYGGGNRVNYNTLDHTFGAGNPEDLVNMYKTSGIPSDPVQIIGNHFRGGGPSKSGGGILVGDNDGHDFRVEDNILVNPGQYGISAPAGRNITLKNNKVYGKQQSFTNVGMYVGLGSEVSSGHVCDGPSIEVSGNLVKWTNKNGQSNGWYNCPCCPNVNQFNNDFKANIDESILPAVIELNESVCGVNNGNSHPNVSFTNIQEGDEFIEETTIDVEISASDNDGSVNSVELKVDGNSEGVLTSSPYHFQLTGLALGTHTIEAIATDNEGATTNTSISITVKVDDGALSFTPIDDAYLQGSTRYNTSDLRIENGNRVSYLKFDVSGTNGTVTSATLELSVGGDAGNGTIRIYSGNGNEWTENNIDDSNKPSTLMELDHSTQSYDLGGTVIYDVSDFVDGNGTYSFIVELDAGGNDVSFASSESGPSPKLTVIAQPVLGNQAFDFDKSVYLFPNPTSAVIQLKTELKNDFNYSIFTSQGMEIANGITSANSEIDISNLPNGIYTITLIQGNQKTFKQIIKN